MILQSNTDGINFYMKLQYVSSCPKYLLLLVNIILITKKKDSVVKMNVELCATKTELCDVKFSFPLHNFNHNEVFKNILATVTHRLGAGYIPKKIMTLGM